MQYCYRLESHGSILLAIPNSLGLEAIQKFIFCEITGPFPLILDMPSILLAIGSSSHVHGSILLAIGSSSHVHGSILLAIDSSSHMVQYCLL